MGGSLRILLHGAWESEYISVALLNKVKVSLHTDEERYHKLKNTPLVELVKHGRNETMPSVGSV